MADHKCNDLKRTRSVCPLVLMAFTDLKLIEPIQQALKKEGYKHPTPIQEQAIPVLLDGKDFIGIAQTGTGKTAAFVLPLLQHLHTVKQMPSRYAPRSLIIAPTRELAAQIGESIKAYGRNLRLTHTVIFGGVGQHPQVKALAAGVDILVATPGRLLDLVEQRFLKLDKIEYFVLDEADRMLDMGFIHDVKKTIAMLPKKRHSVFFSATMSSELDKLAASLLHNPQRVEVTPQATTVERIAQKVLFVDQNKKDSLLLQLLEGEHLERVLVFAQMKHRANKIEQLLNKNRIKADAIHGNKTQSARQKALRDFQKGKCRVLVATDIAARGIDVESISHVINYDLPNEAESYVHRIGRTARAGSDGTAYSFCSAQERNYLRDIEKLTKQKIEIMEHDFHSEAAKNATGANARPPPRGQRSGGNFRGGPRREGGSRGSPRSRGPPRGGSRSRGAPRGGSREGSSRSSSREGQSSGRSGSRGSGSSSGNRGNSRRGPPRRSPRNNS